MDYKEKLKDPKWQRKKSEIMMRDDFTCQMCGSKEKTLHVHHLTYDNCVNGEPWSCPDEDLITWCEECHEKHHHDETLNTLQDCYKLIALPFLFICAKILKEKNKKWKQEWCEFAEKNFGMHADNQGVSVPTNCILIRFNDLHKAIEQWNEQNLTFNELIGEREDVLRLLQKSLRLYNKSPIF